jgi:hypothetical protein
MPVMKVTDYAQWGKLVKSWATGTNYLDRPVPPIPTSIADLKKACEQIGVGIEIPEAVTGLVVVQQSENTKVLVLPPKALVEAVAEELAQPDADYPIPLFYDVYYGRTLDVPANKMADFHACRIGDYTINQCA